MHYRVVCTARQSILSINDVAEVYEVKENQQYGT